jgi:hypothetical protein
MKPTFWIKSRSFDWWWFIAPMALPPLVVFFLPQHFTDQQKTEIFPWSWILIVLLIDVAHVYSTIYKTYCKPAARVEHRLKLIMVPLLVWMSGIFVYSISTKLFWSLLAYFAVFHFIRQQYGFFRLYSLRSTRKKWMTIVLNSTIYAVTIIPILIWHCNGQRNFNWMTEGDFVYFNLPLLIPVLNGLLAVCCCLYLWVEWKEWKINEKLNVPRILLTLSTGLSYYVSIVLTNNDFVFSLVNVVGHGIPYLALVWYSEKKVLNESSSGFLKYIFSKWGWIAFYLIVLGLAYAEESAWDVFVWRENSESFGWLYSTFDAISDDQLLAFVVPFLIMPQVVHYILDGYIWKKKHTTALRKSG